MLFRALTVQVFLSYALLLIPLAVGLLFALLALPLSGPILNLLIMVTGLHTSLDFLTVLYFITPYRQFIIRKVLRLHGYLGLHGVDSRENTTRTRRNAVTSGIVVRTTFTLSVTNVQP